MLKWLKKDAPFRIKVRAMMLFLEAWLLFWLVLGSIGYSLHTATKHLLLIGILGCVTSCICVFFIWRLLTNNTVVPLETLVFRSRERDKQNHEIIKILGNALSEVANGDLEVRIHNSVFDGEFSALRAAFNESTSRLSAALCTIINNSELIATGANEIAIVSDDLAKRTETQAENLGEITEAVRNITEGVRNTAQLCAEENDETKQSMELISSATAVMQKTVEAMDRIKESSDSIGNIISVIDGIAFQTNILALNAGVEAARAGDAGRGFAAVAQEVRSLAEKSVKSSNEIKRLISVATGQVSKGVDLVQQTSRYLDEITESTENIAKRSTKISSATRDQTASLSDITSSLGDMDQITHQNATMVVQATTASHNLASSTQTLKQTLGQFNVGNCKECCSEKPKSLSAKPQKFLTRTVDIAFNSAFPTTDSDKRWEEF